MLYEALDLYTPHSWKSFEALTSSHHLLSIFLNQAVVVRS